MKKKLDELKSFIAISAFNATMLFIAAALYSIGWVICAGVVFVAWLCLYALALRAQWRNTVKEIQGYSSKIE